MSELYRVRISYKDHEAHKKVGKHILRSGAMTKESKNPSCNQCGSDWAVEWQYSQRGWWCHNCKCWVVYREPTSTIREKFPTTER